MKKNKGFTLVEMLGVLVLLIIVFMIMFPSLTRMLKNTNSDIDAATLSIIEDATATFLTDQNNLYPRDDDYTYCISLSELIDNANLTEKQIASLDDKEMVVKTTFKNNIPVYSITKSCTSVVMDAHFTLIGENNMSFEVGVGGQYVEPGATALNKAGESVSYTATITNSKKETLSYVDTTKIDIYTVKYSATIDGKSCSIERIVKVIDTTSPTIVVNPTTETIAITNSTYNVLGGVTASDNSGVIPTIKASTNLSLGQAGTYTVTYTATDSSGNTKTAKRIVKIIDATFVTIDIGTKNITYDLALGRYIDAGATARDNKANSLTSLLTKMIFKNGNTIDEEEIDKPGRYYITYNINKDNVIYNETRTVDIVRTMFANGTAVYFNPVSGTECTRAEYRANPNASMTGNKSGCMKWYTFGDTVPSTTLNMILDHNTTAIVQWNSGGFNMSGPNQVLTTLKSDTSTWTGVATRTDSYVLSNGLSNYTINYSTYKARLITAKEIATIQGNTAFNEKTTLTTAVFYINNFGHGMGSYYWLFDHTITCLLYGCTIADATTYGYWTSTAVPGSVLYAWKVDNLGHLDIISVALLAYGVRPVITIPKSKIL